MAYGNRQYTPLQLQANMQTEILGRRRYLLSFKMPHLPMLFMSRDQYKTKLCIQLLIKDLPEDQMFHYSHSTLLFYCCGLLIFLLLISLIYAKFLHYILHLAFSWKEIAQHLESISRRQQGKKSYTIVYLSEEVYIYVVE